MKNQFANEFLAFRKGAKMDEVQQRSKKSKGGEMVRGKTNKNKNKIK